MGVHDGRACRKGARPCCFVVDGRRVGLRQGIEVAFLIVRKLNSQKREVRLVVDAKEVGHSLDRGFVHQGDVVALLD